jgi:hypothetical protein
MDTLTKDIVGIRMHFETCINPTTKIVSVKGMFQSSMKM